jgi:hypothetical protein
LIAFKSTITNYHGHRDWSQLGLDTNSRFSKALVLLKNAEPKNFGSETITPPPYSFTYQLVDESVISGSATNSILPGSQWKRILSPFLIEPLPHHLLASLVLNLAVEGDTIQLDPSHSTNKCTSDMETDSFRKDANAEHLLGS